MGYELRLRLQGLPKTTNALNVLHWAVKAAHAKKWKQAIWHAVLQQSACGRAEGSFVEHPLLTRAKLKLIRCSSVQPDFDGLVSSFKHVIDGLIAAKIIQNDTEGVIGQPEYEWRKAPRLEGHILVEVSSHD